MEAKDILLFERMTGYSNIFLIYYLKKHTHAQEMGAESLALFSSRLNHLRLRHLVHHQHFIRVRAFR